jgi:hypothetical protein
MFLSENPVILESDAFFLNYVSTGLLVPYSIPCSTRQLLHQRDQALRVLFSTKVFVVVLEILLPVVLQVYQPLVLVAVQEESAFFAVLEVLLPVVLQVYQPLVLIAV